MRRLLLALLLVAFSAMAIPPAVVGTAPGKRPKFGVSDNFNRDDGDVGANWTTITSFSAGSILSNGYVSSVYNGTAGSYWNGGTFGGDQYAEAKLTGSNYGSPGIVVRASSTANTMYLFRSTSGSGWRLHKYVDGVEKWWTSSLAYSPPNGSIIRLEAIGSAINVYSLSVHGGAKTAVYLLASDADPILTGWPGVYHTGRNNGQGGNADDWYGGDL